MRTESFDYSGDILSLFINLRVYYNEGSCLISWAAIEIFIREFLYLFTSSKVGHNWIWIVPSKPWIREQNNRVN